MSDEQHRHAAQLLAEGHTQVAAADAVGVSARTLRRWIADGKVPEVSANGTNGNGRASSGLSADWTRAEADRRKAIALARLRELEVAQRRGELVHLSTIEEELGPVLDRLRRGILNVEGRWAQHFPGCDPKDAAAVLRRMAHELLETLSGAGVGER